MLLSDRLSRKVVVAFDLLIFAPALDLCKTKCPRQGDVCSALSQNTKDTISKIPLFCRIVHCVETFKIEFSNILFIFYIIKHHILPHIPCHGDLLLCHGPKFWHVKATCQGDVLSVLLPSVQGGSSTKQKYLYSGLWVKLNAVIIKESQKIISKKN